MKHALIGYMITENHLFKNMLHVTYIIEYCHELLKVIEHGQITGKTQAKDEKLLFSKGRCYSQKGKANRNFSYWKFSKLLYLTITTTSVG